MMVPLYVLRVAAIITVLPPFLFYWYFLSLPLGEARVVVSWLCVIGLAWFLWVNFTPGQNKTHGALSSAIVGALLLGSLGFWVGFAGPLHFHTGGNQGPLLGIIFTGPLGFIAGGIAGFMYWLRS